MENTDALIKELKDEIENNRDAEMRAVITRIPLLCKSVLDIHEGIKEIKEQLNNKFVTKEAFEPVRSVIYGLIGIILSAVVGSLMFLILK